jgi:phosphoribosylformylglycinamidine (FGAM) synthase PurS component/DNA-binding transcriptional MerR regulator
MGGAAGHMAHPFDCREVRNGRDLVKFYVKAVNAIPLYDEETKGSSVSVKLDGVNASFRLQKADNPAGFMFVLDRGGKTPGPVTGIDFDGVTSDNVLARVKGNEGHGLIQVVNHMTKLLNHDLMKLRPYVEALGLFDRMGPEGVFFDAEYYANEDEKRGYKPIKNNVNYSKNYIAIHRLSEFYIDTRETKTGKVSKRRLSRGFYWETVAEINDLLKQKDQLFSQRQNTAEIDQLIAQKNNELKIKKQEHQEVLDDLAKAVQEHASDLDMGFDVLTKVGLRFKEGLTREVVLRRIENALDMKVPYNYLKINDKESIGPTTINEQTGEAEPRTLKQLLLSVDKNPAHVAFYPDTPGFTKDGESVKGRIQTKSGYKKDPKQSAFALQIYEDVMETGHETGIGPFDIGNSPRDAEAINNAVILWHAVRHIGNAIKESIVSDVDLGVEGGDKEHEGIVIQSADICDGIAFKFTGEFIVDNRAGGFGVTPKGEDIPSDSSEALHEGNIRYGKLIESFMAEPINLAEQEQKQYVILIPGGFKPPTGGHYDLIKQYDKNSNIRKVFVITGAKERQGVTLKQSKAIFAVYGGFSDKVEFVTSNDPTPLTTCYELMKNENFVNQFPNAYFSIGAGDKGNDPARINDFANYFLKNPNLTTAKVEAYEPAKAFMIDGEAASASRLRKAFTEGDWETFKKLLPNEAFYDDVVQILSGQDGGPVNENFLLAVPQSFLVEGKKEIAAKTEFLIKKEKMKPDQAYAIANSMAERGKLEEELVTEEKFIDALRPYLQNIFQIEDIAASFGAAGQNIDMKEEVLDALATAVSKQLEEIIAEKTAEVEQAKAAAKAQEAEKLASLEEMSSMAGGAVQGYAGNAFIGEEDDEQKRPITARV